MSTRVRFAPSPTGSLHLGSALSAVANRRRGDWFLLRIDDTDPRRNLPGGEEELVRDLEWLGIVWNEGPVRQSERREQHLEAARALGERFDGITLVREDGTPTYHLASVVDDVHFGITHVDPRLRPPPERGPPPAAARGARDRAAGVRPPRSRPRAGRQEALEAEPRRRDGRRSARAGDSRRRRCAPTSRSWGCRAHDVHLDLPRIRRLAIDAIEALSDEELAARAGAPPQLARALRGARDLVEARAMASAILEPRPVTLPGEARPTLERFAELRVERARRQGDRARAEGGRRRPPARCGSRSPAPSAGRSSGR